MTTQNREHVISIVLSDPEWQAFIRLQPQPVAWLRSRILEALATNGPVSPSNFSPSRAGEANTTSATTRSSRAC